MGQSRYRLFVGEKGRFVDEGFAEFLSLKQNGITCLERDNAFEKKIPFSPAGRTRLARYFVEYTLNKLRSPYVYGKTAVPVPP
jgi:hypothetical protein